MLTDPDHDRSLRELRARWQTASLAAGWRFPSDWALPEVDAVCAAAIRGGGTEIPLAGLARARAAAGAGLAEVLTDLAALHAVLNDPRAEDGFVSPDVDAIPARMLRVTALAWADVTMDQLARIEVVDPLTGLPNSAYLRTRLGELYRQAESAGQKVSAEHTLLVVSLDLSTVSGWHRVTGMILLAEALRTVLDGGESIATLGPSTLVAVLPRDGQITSKAIELRRVLHERLSVDDQLDGMSGPRIRLVRLPATHEAAADLLRRLARS
ncbi:GGDEF domain-containing protein [Amycolatopsis acidiphila]|uniref:GGDEF domain-containing protein n=1 Tax=Amycolatopsis acidiphila TaxID=715473 RepID=A0A558A0H5_9PSEU|nr:GGDEF domain-containing protein [Amycolatopsis acidiphila]TVT17768.1 GGDEF domain-containing protein [Amycolatopsis acidiphila]UIJ63740.1 GGDEF domain-containing protein [Amycolatopsis acidiphila]